MRPRSWSGGEPLARPHFLFPLLALAVALAACSPAAAPEPTVVTTTVPTPEQDLASVALALLDAGSFRFGIAIEGPPIQVDVLGGLSLAAAEGVAVLPDQAQGDASGSIGPLPLTAPFVAIGPDLWLANPLGGWLELEAADVVDIPGVLAGLPSILAEDVTQVVAEEVDGVTAFRGTLDTAGLSTLAGGHLGVGQTALRASTDLDGSLALVVFEDPVEIGRIWTFSFSEPGVEAEVVAPPS